MISFVNKLIITVAMLLVSSCGSEGVKWDPVFYTGRNGYIINRHQEKIMCDEPRFKQMLCLTKEKVLELKEILDRARIPKRKKRAAMDILNRVIRNN